MGLPGPASGAFGMWRREGRTLRPLRLSKVRVLGACIPAQAIIEVSAAIQGVAGYAFHSLAGSTVIGYLEQLLVERLSLVLTNPEGSKAFRGILSDFASAGSPEALEGGPNCHVGECDAARRGPCPTPVVMDGAQPDPPARPRRWSGDSERGGRRGTPGPSPRCRQPSRVSIGTPSIIDKSAIVISRSSVTSFIACSVLVQGIGLRERVHSLVCLPNPLRTNSCCQRSAAHKIGSQWAQLARPSSSHLATSTWPPSDRRSRSEPLDSAHAWPSGRETGLEQDHPTEPMRLRLWQRPALRWNCRSPPAPSTHAMADVAALDARCLTWSEALLSRVPNGIRTPRCRLERAAQAYMTVIENC